MYGDWGYLRQLKMSYGGNEANHVESVGPWGGQTGSRWDDGVYTGVRQVVISTSSSGIHSIQFEYDKNGHAIWSHKYGGHSGTRTDQIILDYPTQSIVSISGYYGPVTEGGSVIVRSLTLETNRGKYGPFGIEHGVPFMIPINDAMLVGFHGLSSRYLDSIGVYVKHVLQNKHLELQKMVPRFPTTNGYTNHGSSRNILSLGPWGGDGGMAFDDGIYTGVREVHIKRSGGLVSLRVCYDQNGRAVWGRKNGGTGGLKLDKIVFDYPYEVLTHITGFYRSMIFRGPTIVKSITFHTNKRSYGPFGDEQGFSFTSGSLGPIIGFHGKNGYFVDSIGVHVLETKLPLLPQPFDISKQDNSETVWGVPKQAMLYESGPWGGERGMAWDDGVYSGVRKVILSRGDAISSIQFQYDQNGHSLWSASHGIVNDAYTFHIKFDYPYEVLTCITGYYDTIAGDMQRVIRSLTFHTNRDKYGPYGKPIGTYFSSATNNVEGKIVGFYGRSGTFLDAIGVHMQHWVHKNYR